MRSIIKKILLLTGLYDRIRWSSLYSLYIRFRNPEVDRQAKRELHFLKKTFASDKMEIIFDIGANQGDKTQQYLSFSPKRIVAFDPDIKNQKILKRRFGRFSSISLDSNAVSDRIGKSKFYVLSPGDALNSLNPKWKELLENEQANRWKIKHEFQKEVEITTTTIDDCIKKYGCPDYIKIDVEGHELQCLLGLNQAIKFISFECNLPEFLDETLMCIDRINSLNPEYKYGFYNGKEDFVGNRVYSYNDAKAFVVNTDLRYFEVYALLKTEL